MQSCANHAYTSLSLSLGIMNKQERCLYSSAFSGEGTLFETLPRPLSTFAGLLNNHPKKSKVLQHYDEESGSKTVSVGEGFQPSRLGQAYPTLYTAGRWTLRFHLGTSYLMGSWSEGRLGENLWGYRLAASAHVFEAAWGAELSETRMTSIFRGFEAGLLIHWPPISV